MISAPSLSRSTRIRRLVIALSFAIAVSSVAPVSAQTSEIEDAKTAREAKRAEVAAAAADLDPLFAQDEELDAAVKDLELHVQTQQAKLAGIQQSLDNSREAATEAANRVGSVQLEIEQLRDLLADRAIEVYMAPDDERVDTLLSSDDVTVAAHKRALLDTVSRNESDIIDQLRAAEGQLVDLQTEADAAVARVVGEEAKETDQLAVLEVALGTQEEVKTALEVRIAEAEAEMDAIEAEESAITNLIAGLIAEEDARVAAIARAEAIRQEQARIAAQQASRPSSSEPSSVPTLEPLPAPVSASGLIRPSSGVITSFFGPRWGRNHNGLDIAAASGSAVVAAQSGQVVSAENYGGYGNMVIIDHGGGFTTLYGHLTDIFVSVGQTVGQGEQVGTMGCTGSCTGPHVHFETRVNGAAQDPLLYM